MMRTSFGAKCIQTAFLLAFVVFTGGIFSSSAAANLPDPVFLPADSDGPLLIRGESIPISNGAQLLVFFERLQSPGGAEPRQSEIPLFAVLRDNLSDNNPAVDRLRQVWVFTYASPSLPQRFAAGVPFLYHRSGLDSGSAAHPPKPILDIGRPARGTWRRILMTAAQAEVFDPFGAVSRLTTRSYGSNLGEYRKTHIAEIVNLINDHAGDLTASLSHSEIETVSSRLDLNLRILGGYVSDERLPAVFMRSTSEAAENRGHNWEVLRQSAERNGLYFEPLRFADAPGSFAMIWIAQPDALANHSFDSQFMRIANPFEDARLASWKGYSQVWTLDRDGVRVPDGTPGGTQVTVIPLAVYSLDYPGVPLLLIDFRDARRPQRAEMASRLANDVTTGVLGLTTFGNLGYFAAKSGYLFIHKRHGGATDRISRRTAFIQLRHALGVDGSLDPEFRAELMSRLEKLDLDPVEKSWWQELRAAWRQYDALMKYAADPGGMARLVEADRWEEYRSRRHQVREWFANELFQRSGRLTEAQLAELKDWRVRESDKAREDDRLAEPPPILAADAPGTVVRSAATGGQ